MALNRDLYIQLDKKEFKQGNLASFFHAKEVTVSPEGEATIQFDQDYTPYSEIIYRTKSTNEKKTVTIDVDAKTAILNLNDVNINDVQLYAENDVNTFFLRDGQNPGILDLKFDGNDSGTQKIVVDEDELLSNSDFPRIKFGKYFINNSQGSLLGWSNIDMEADTTNQDYYISGSTDKSKKSPAGKHSMFGMLTEDYWRKTMFNRVSNSLWDSMEYQCVINYNKDNKTVTVNFYRPDIAENSASNQIDWNSLDSNSLTNIHSIRFYWIKTRSLHFTINHDNPLITLIKVNPAKPTELPITSGTYEFKKIIDDLSWTNIPCINTFKNSISWNSSRELTGKMAYSFNAGETWGFTIDLIKYPTIVWQGLTNATGSIRNHVTGQYWWEAMTNGAYETQVKTTYWPARENYQSNNLWVSTEYLTDFDTNSMLNDLILVEDNENQNLDGVETTCFDNQKNGTYQYKHNIKITLPGTIINKEISVDDSMYLPSSGSAQYANINHDFEVSYDIPLFYDFLGKTNSFQFYNKNNNIPVIYRENDYSTGWFNDSTKIIVTPIVCLKYDGDYRRNLPGIGDFEFPDCKYINQAGNEITVKGWQICTQYGRAKRNHLLCGSDTWDNSDNLYNGYAYKSVTNCPAFWRDYIWDESTFKYNFDSNERNCSTLPWMEFWNNISGEIDFPNLTANMKAWNPAICLKFSTNNGLTTYHRYYSFSPRFFSNKENLYSKYLKNYSSEVSLTTSIVPIVNISPTAPGAIIVYANSLSWEG